MALDTKQNSLAPIWCLVANVREFTRHGHGGLTIQRGLKHFSGSAKVYCFPPLWGDGYEDIRVVGRHRGTARLIRLVLPSRYLSNWRAKLVYEPRVLRLLTYPDGSPIWGSDENGHQTVEDMAVHMRARGAQLAEWNAISGMEPRIPVFEPCEPALGRDAMAKYLIRQLADDDRRVRAKAVRLLGALEHPDVVDPLAALLEREPVDYVRLDCLAALRQIGTAEARATVERWQARQSNDRTR